MAKKRVKGQERFKEVGAVQMRLIPERVMFLKEQQGDGVIDGKKFNLATVIPGGSPLVRFEDGTQFIVEHGDICRAAYDAYRKVKRGVHANR